MLLGILTPRQKAKLEEKLSVDIGYGVRGLARFRGNIYMQRGTIAASLPPHPVPDQEHRGPRPAAGAARFLRHAHGPGAGHRPDRQRQVHHPRGADPLHRHAPAGARDHHRRPDGVPVHRRRGLDLPARGGDRHRQLLRGAAQRHAPGPRRHHGRRDARPGDHLDRDHRGRDRPPGVLDPAHQQRAADRRPHPRHLPGRPAGADPRAARPGAQGRGLDEAGGAPGRPRPGGGARDHAGLAQDLPR